MKKILIVICIVLSLCAIVGAGGFFYVYHQIMTPVALAGQEQIILIEKGLGVKQIGAKLQEAGIINDTFYFETYIWIERISNLQAGEYALNPEMNIPEIAEMMVAGRVIKREVKITVPEGFTVAEIDARLAEAELIQPGELINYKDPIHNLEGYLFPDTYIFEKTMTVEDIVGKMTDNFSEKITEEMRKTIEKQGKTLEDVVIMASIVEQEAVMGAEMPQVASVFYNRLKIGMALQSDATVNYVTGQARRQPTTSDTKIDSPYNTYQYKGLPPGPICNPGLAAIKAAIWPASTDYYYFLHPTSDSSAVFSRTSEEHLANKAKWLK